MPPKVLLTCILACAAPLAASPSANAAPSLRHLIGEKLVVSMDGTAPSPSLLDRARRGRIGGVLIHGYNFSSAAQLTSITTKVQRAAADGGRPPLLVAVDQGGGSGETVSRIPPTPSAPRMGGRGPRDVAPRQGGET